MINGNDPTQKSANDYMEHMRQKIGYGHSDKAEARTAKKELGKDDFIKLMSVQLKYQDPTSPLKNEEMAAQLAQFSGLEQMQNVNRNLEKTAASSEVRDSMAAAALIGKRVETDSAKFKLTEDRNVEVKFDLPAGIDRGKVAIVDAKGNVVRDLVLGEMEKGPQSLKWDGRDEKGTNATLGEFTFRVTAYDKGGKKVDAKTSTEGVITGIEFEKGKPVLLVGAERVYMDVVSKIEEVGAKGSSASAAAPKDPKAAQGAPVDPTAPQAGGTAANPEAEFAAAMAAARAAAAAPEAQAGKTAAEAFGWPSQMSGANAAPQAQAARTVDSELADRDMIIEDRADLNAPAETAPAPRARSAAAAEESSSAETARLPGSSLWNPAENEGEGA